MADSARQNFNFDVVPVSEIEHVHEWIENVAPLLRPISNTSPALAGFQRIDGCANRSRLHAAADMIGDQMPAFSAALCNTSQGFIWLRE